MSVDNQITPSPATNAEGYKHILHVADGHKTVVVDDSEEHPFGDELEEGDRVQSIPLIPRAILQNIADKITALNRHPAATDEYWGGYADGRNDAWLVVQSVIDDLPEPPSPEPLLSTREMQAQAQRCDCHGSDDYCPCQNVPDAETRRRRAALKTTDGKEVGG